MKKEKLILLFIATLLGLLVAGVAFYLFQTTKIIKNPSTKIISVASPTPANSTPSISLILDRPKDEEVVSNKVLIVSGKTQANATVVIITDSSEDIIAPSANGSFSTTINLDDGQNILEVTSISPNGESITNKKTVTYSQEEF